MKKNASFFTVILLSAGFLLSSLIACSLSSAVNPAAANQSASETAFVPPAVEVSPPPATSTLALPSPTPYIPPPPTLTPLPLPQNVSSNPIQFDLGGTSEDIHGSVASGSSKTYTLNAMQGQIMSVSVFGGYFPLHIQGRDGTVLCPVEQNTECYFWRGALPLSQDYFVTVESSGDQTSFTLRVAINPPGQDAQYFQYKNFATGLSLRYPDTFAPAMPVVGNYKITPELTLRFIDSKFYDKTNLSEVYLFAGSTSDAQVVATCTEPNQNGGGPEQVIGNEVVNGFTFVHSASEGVGAGNIYEQEIYRMVNQNICYEVTYFTHSTNIGNYTPGAVTEFDRGAVMQNLQAVLSTIAIK